MTDALRVEVAGHGIHVALVEPGGFRTEIWEDMERDIDKRGDSRFGSAYRRSQQGMKLSSSDHGRADASARDVIATVISTRHPRPRYLVGMDARALATMDRFTPTAAEGPHHSHRTRPVT